MSCLNVCFVVWKGSTQKTVPKWGMSEYSSCMNQPMFFVHSSFTVPVRKETGLILPSCKRILGISNITWLSTQGLNSASDGDMFGTWKDKFHNLIVFSVLVERMKHQSCSWSINKEKLPRAWFVSAHSSKQEIKPSPFNLCKEIKA